MARPKTHGLKRSPSYNSWHGMMNRCYSTKNISYPNYGGRGIKVDPRWHLIKNFFEDMGHRPEGMSLDRIDNSKDYSKENCRWADRKTQNNNKRSNIIFEHEGKSMTIREWSVLLGVSWYSIYQRIKAGWTSEDIVNTPQLHRKINKTNKNMDSNPTL